MWEKHLEIKLEATKISVSDRRKLLYMVNQNAGGYGESGGGGGDCHDDIRTFWWS